MQRCDVFCGIIGSDQAEMNETESESPSDGDEVDRNGSGAGFEPVSISDDRIWQLDDVPERNQVCSIWIVIVNNT